MLSRKPAVAFCAYSSLPFNHHPASPPGCTTSCRAHRQHLSPIAPPPVRSRSYAQHVPAEGPHSDASDLSWPDAVHPHRSPTPYQILRCGRGQAYTKHRFYALVKLYHPDRSDVSSPVAHLPRHLRLERYRLLVAAHAILSDDAKRQAYDAWGLGWSGHHHLPSQYPHHTWASEQRQWTHDPSHNATWEDWERWHHREAGTEEPPRDLYMSNIAFVSLVFTIVTLGGIMQGTRANMFGTSVMEQRDKIHKEASIELARSKRATMSGDRDERIKTFLEHREATLAGEDAYQRLLPPNDTCDPDTIRKR